MRADIVPGALFPDYALPDHRGKHRTLSELQQGDPFVLVLSRGGFCPKDRRQHEGLVQLHREMAVGYCRLVTISTDNLLETSEFRSGVGAHWPFLSDPGRKLQKDLDIAEYTDPHHNPMIPHTLVPFSERHTKVSGDTIVQSTRRHMSGVIPSAHCVSMDLNRLRDRPLPNRDPSMTFENLQYPPRVDKLVLARDSTIETALSSSPTRRSFLAGSLAALSVGLLVLASPNQAQTTTSSDTDTVVIAATPATGQAAEDRSIRPFNVHVPQAALDDLRRRVLATRWPDKETVADRSQGTQLAKLQELVRYWGTDYDWRKVEAKLNGLPQFITTIDGLDIHFIHVRSRHPNSLPVIITHGWPGSVTEQLEIIAPLTDPTAHGGGVQDAFDVVIPSMPGYGFSGKPTGAGWNPDRIARAWAELMQRLGYARYVAQGGDWGSPVSSAMARQAPAGLLGIHINLPATVPPDVAAVLASGGPAPAGLSEKERAAFDSLDMFYKKYRAYAAMMGTRPQVIGQALTDSPAGLAAWMYDYNNGEPERLLTKDDFLDDVTLYWLTNSATSSARLYWETSGQSVLLAAAQKTADILLPVAITVFPEEVYRAPETWARRAYRNLSYFHEVDKGGHFAAWEQPELFAAELRAAFRSLRPAH